MEEERLLSRSSTILLVTASLTAAAVCATALVKLASFADFRPTVGDIISFDGTVPLPTLSPAAEAPEMARLMVRREGGGTCVLDPRAMAANHGSLMVTAYDPAGRLPFAAHWVGGPTGPGDADCGRETDLRLAANDLLRLVNAAGGSGPEANKRPGPAMAFAPPAM